MKTLFIYNRYYYYIYLWLIFFLMLYLWLINKGHGGHGFVLVLHEGELNNGF